MYARQFQLNSNPTQSNNKTKKQAKQKILYRTQMLYSVRPANPVQVQVWNRKRETKKDLQYSSTRMMIPLLSPQLRWIRGNVTSTYGAVRAYLHAEEEQERGKNAYPSLFASPS